MGRIFLIILLSCSIGYSQHTKVKIEFDKDIEHPFFHSNDSVYNPMTLVFKDDSGRLHYDNVPDSNKYATQANIILNNDINRHIKFGKVTRGDEVFYIMLDEGGPSESLSLKIIVKGSTGDVSFFSSTPTLGEAKVSLTTMTLVLNEMYPKKGDLLKGKVSFRAICKKKCGYQTYEGEGYFKCIVL